MTAVARSAVLVVALAAAAVAIAVVAMVALPGEPPATYRAASHAATVVAIAAGAALVAAALVTYVLTHRTAVALLLLALAVLWFGQDLQALGDSEALIRSLATGAGALTAAVALQLALALPDGRLSRNERGVAGAAYLASALSAAGMLVLRDPFLDVYCWRECAGNPLLVHSAPHVARAFVVAGIGVAIVVSSAVVVVVARRLVAATSVRRRLLAPALVPAALLATAEAGRGVALLAVPLEDPQRAGFMAIYLLRGGALALVALGVTWTALHTWRTRARVKTLAAELGRTPEPGTLKDALAAALGDPTVDVRYWVPALGRFAAADGAPRRQPSGASTRITRGGRLLAVVVHDVTTLSGEDLERLLGPAARLAIENEALRAEVLAQLDQLRRSRARIVATADDARRRLERDLHDGAQQRLLSVILDLRMARAGADGTLDETLERLCQEVDLAFGELRELAHGIYPAVLTEAGLEAALPALAARAPLVVRVDDVPDHRLPASVEAGAYVTVDEAIRDAAARDAAAIGVGAAVRAGHLVVTVSDDGAPRAAAMIQVADRVGALGGVLELAPTSLRAEIPCE
jgi:signal transduction histidine kinase